MPVVRLTKRLRFNATHRLYNPELDEQENRRLYGKCSDPGGHPHTYRLEVTVEGPTDPRTGMLMNFAEIEAIVRTEVLDRFDGKDLNTEVEAMRGRVPTAEHIAAVIWDRLEPKLAPRRLVEVTVGETESNIAVYRGQGAERD